MYKISKQFSFEASHILNGMPEGHKCGRLHGHGYIVEIVLQSETLDEHGFVIDYGDLQPLKQYIDSNLDHRHLNDVFLGVNPTAENIAKIIFDVSTEWWEGLIKEVRVSETAKTWAVYSE